MLIFVPVLAGLWPAVRAVVNQHHAAIQDANTVLTKTIEDFEQGRLALSEQLKSIEKIISQVNLEENQVQTTVLEINRIDQAINEKSSRFRDVRIRI